MQLWFSYLISSQSDIILLEISRFVLVHVEESWLQIAASGTIAQLQMHAVGDNFQACSDVVGGGC